MQDLRVKKPVTVRNNFRALRNRIYSRNKPFITESREPCSIVYQGRGVPRPCGGRVDKVERFIRSEISLGGPSPRPHDVYLFCTRCGVRRSLV